MKVFVTGASSTPGYKILLEFARAGYKVYAQYNTHEIPDIENVSKIKLDFSSELEKLVEVLNNVKPDVVVHTAAIGDVDLCEKEKQLAWIVNVEATRALAAKASKLGIRVLYLSTDYVFDGEKGMYREEDIPNPINYYGLTKLIAENIVISAVDNYAVIRTSHIYGFGMGRKNFARYVVEALSRRQEVRAVVDQWLSPTLNTLLAKAVREIVEKGYTGLLHVAGEKVNRYEFARAIAGKFGFDEALIKPVSVSEFKFTARRPRDSSLDSSNARSLLRTEFHSLEHSLEVLYSEWLESSRGG